MKTSFKHRFYILIFCIYIFSVYAQSKSVVIFNPDENSKKLVEDTVLLSEQYPNDLGMENDPNVLFIEKLEGKLADIHKRYSDVKYPQYMSLQPGVPIGSLSPYCLRISNNGGTTDGGHLYKKFDPGFEGTVYLRYYVKYPLVSKSYFHHIGVRIGGYDPPSGWPVGMAGICNVQTRFSLAYEPVTNDGLMETYMYWPKMHGSGDQCYGNYLIRNNGRAKTLVFDQWMCVEMMIKLNDPGEYNGELRIWQDGEELGYWKQGYPTGRWNGGAFLYSGEPLVPFEGFLWWSKEHPNLNVNYIKLEFYDSKSPAASHNNYVEYANIVVAKKRIGPLVNSTTTAKMQPSDAGITIYSNPSNTTLTITGGLSLKEKAGITIYTLNGTKTYGSSHEVSFPHSIDISAYMAGIYLVKVSTGGKHFTQRVVKK